MSAFAADLSKQFSVRTSNTSDKIAHPPRPQSLNEADSPLRRGQSLRDAIADLLCERPAGCATRSYCKTQASFRGAGSPLPPASLDRTTAVRSLSPTESAWPADDAPPRTTGLQARFRAAAALPRCDLVLPAPSSGHAPSHSRPAAGLHRAFSGQPAGEWPEAPMSPLSPLRKAGTTSSVLSPLASLRSSSPLPDSFAASLPGCRRTCMATSPAAAAAAVAAAAEAGGGRSCERKRSDREPGRADPAGQDAAAVYPDGGGGCAGAADGSWRAPRKGSVPLAHSGSPGPGTRISSCEAPPAAADDDDGGGDLAPW